MSNPHALAACRLFVANVAHHAYQLPQRMPCVTQRVARKQMIAKTPGQAIPAYFLVGGLASLRGCRVMMVA